MFFNEIRIWALDILMWELNKLVEKASNNAVPLPNTY